MLPAETRLMPLCLRYLQIHYLDEVPAPYPFPIDENPALDSLPKSDPGTIPMVLKVNNELVHDNFYWVKASYDKALGLVQKGVVKVLAWSFEVKDGMLELKIHKAVTMTNTVGGDQVVTQLDHNAKIKAALHKVRHHTMTKVAQENPVVPCEDTESDISENSALEEKPLAALQASPVKIASPAPVKSPNSIPRSKQVTPVPHASPSQRPAAPASPSQRSLPHPSPSQPKFSSPIATLEPAGFYPSKVPIPEPTQVEQPVDIGRGLKSKANAEEFSEERRKRTQHLATQDDLLSPYKVRKIEPRAESSHSKLVLGAGKGEELTIEVFPEWALEFLKYYYKL